MTELFEVAESRPEGPLRNVMYSMAYIPSRCRRCGATFDEPCCYREECLVCDGETEPMQWHEYAASMTNYTPHKHPQIRKLAADLQAEFEKMLRYIGLMESKPGFDAAEVVNLSNRKARQIVSDFEEELWL